MLPRNHDGLINNCALANGASEDECQMCGGTCPDRARHKSGMRKRSELKKPPTDAELAAASPDVLDGPPVPSPDEHKPKPARYEFKSANARDDRDLHLREDLAKIVETVWVEDMHETWQRIRASLKVGVKRSEHGILTKALDHARELSYDAHRLYITAKREQDRWELENEVVFSAMWNEASRELEAERMGEGKSRSKPITDTDVRAKINTLHPEEYAAQEKKRKAVKLVVENMSQLAKDANEHVDDLKVMLAKLRSNG